MQKLLATSLVLFGMVGTAFAQSDSPQQVFDPVLGSPVLQSVATPEMLSPQLVKPRFDVLDAASTGRRLEFDFADGVRHIGVVTTVTRRGHERYTLTGSLEGEESSYFIIAREQEALAGIFHAPASSFYAQMRFAGGEAHWLYGVDESRRPLCAGSPQAPVDELRTDDDIVDRGIGERTSCPPGQPIHDYLVAYTDLARLAAGGANAIQSLIQTYVTYTNLAYSNSIINLRMRMVHSAEVVYDEVDPPGDPPRSALI